MKIWLLFLGCLLLISCGKVTLPPDTQNSLNQTTNYVGQFKSAHATLPTRKDFLAWRKTRDLHGVFDYQTAHGKDGDEYFVYIWLGNKMLVYSSKNNTVRTL